MIPFRKVKERPEFPVSLDEAKELIHMLTARIDELKDENNYLRNSLSILTETHQVLEESLRNEVAKNNGRHEIL